MTIKCVFDTNIIISSLLFNSGRLVWLRTAWEESLLIPMISKETTQELLRVLAYPKFKLSPEERGYLLSEFIPFAETFITDTNLTNEIPLYRDKNDQMFLNLAHQSKIQYLVTGDKDLLEMKNDVNFKIITADKLKLITELNSTP